MTRPAEFYVMPSGDVALPPRACAWLVRNTGLRAAAVANRGTDAEVDQVLLAIVTAALRWRTSQGISSDHGTDQRKQPEAETGSPLTTTQAAGLLNITDRGVRAAIAAQRLNAQRVGDQWLIDREDLEHFRAGRAA